MSRVLSGKFPGGANRSKLRSAFSGNDYIAVLNRRTFASQPPALAPESCCCSSATLSDCKRSTLFSTPLAAATGAHREIFLRFEVQNHDFSGTGARSSLPLPEHAALISFDAPRCRKFRVPSVGHVQTVTGGVTPIARYKLLQSASCAVLIAGVSLSGTPAASARTTESSMIDAGEASNNLVVTGIRASLASSARVKQATSVIVESVSAEDVAKLPDVSVADSLARLPGLTAQRLEGRDQRLSIRGFGPDFSTTLLNGREQVTVGDNRGVEYDQYPSEFFRAANVYKSFDPDLIAAGISGTVDLRMLRPLDEDHRIIAGSIRGQLNGTSKLNPDADRSGHRASLSYVDQFAGRTFGVSLGFATSRIPSQNKRFESWGYPLDNAGNLIIGGAKPYAQSNLLKRDGAAATLEWRPSENVRSTFDLLASHFEETQRLRGIEFPLFWGTGVSVSDIAVDNGFVTGATFNNVYGVQRNDFNKREADMLSLGWNNNLRLTQALTLNLDASWSRAKRTDFLLETYSGTGYLRSGSPDTIRMERQSNGTLQFTPAIDYTDPNVVSLTDPNGWGYNGTMAVVQAGFLNRPKVVDDLKSFRADLTGNLNQGILASWQIGANYSRRKKASAFKSYFLCPTGSGTNCTVSSGSPVSAPVPTEALLGSNVSLEALGGHEMLALDPVYLYNHALTGSFDDRPSSLVRDYVVREEVLTGFAKLGLDGELGSKPLKGAFGVQVIHTRQGSSGTISNFSVIGESTALTVIPVAARENYTHVLPMSHLSVELQPRFFVKLGFAKTIMRPRIDQERINQEFNVDASKVGSGSDPQYSPFSSKGGNVALRPYKSKNIDISVEKYFLPEGYVSVAGYFKQLTDFVDPNNNIAYDFSAALTTLPSAARTIVEQQGGAIGLVKAPANSGRGTMAGIEATASLPLKLIASALNGFGVFANGAYADTEVKYSSNPSASISLPGFSKWVLNGTAYFEREGFQARLSYRYRSSFLGEVAGLSAAPSFRTVRSEQILDAQIGYEFTVGPLSGLSILLQGKNLTDQPFVTYQNDDPRQITDYQKYGPDFYFGLTYRF